MTYLIAKLNCNQILPHPQTIIIKWFTYLHFLTSQVILIVIECRKKKRNLPMAEIGSDMNADHFFLTNPCPIKT
jgi:hypothetical protein